MQAEIDIDEELIQRLANKHLKRSLSSEEMDDVTDGLVQIAENEANSADSIVDIFEDLFEGA